MNERQRGFSVTELNRIIKRKLESDEVLSSFCLEGEVSNYKTYPSGHAYFTLKDSESEISAVMWRSARARLAFLPQNGDQVLVRGSISVYPPRGEYKVSVLSMEKKGAGDALRKLRELAEKLKKEGLFEESRKKKIPAYPEKIALIAGKNSAGMKDLEVNIAKRWPLSEVRPFPSLVQGKEAPAELLSALKKAMDYAPDTLIIGRGGGSCEDLGAFNDEALVRAVADCPIPVIAAVGHEIDVTLIDLVADLRCSTPTAAAVAATPDWREVSLSLDQAGESMDASVTRILSLAKQRLCALAERPYFKDPSVLCKVEKEKIRQLGARLSSSVQNRVSLEKASLGALNERLNGSIRSYLDKLSYRMSELTSKLKALNPESVLCRGYSITTDQTGKPIREAKNLKVGQVLKTRFADGTIESTITHKESQHGE